MMRIVVKVYSEDREGYGLLLNREYEVDGICAYDELMKVKDVFKKDGCLLDIHVSDGNIYDYYFYVDVYKISEGSIYEGLYRIDKKLFAENVSDVIAGYL